ncbi:unnamed protein product [Schistosoma mattheei]|uniref:Uncharacterized protein n=1 Tax=Schistosoma mattheei TaxID=31246 RepID=A0A3P8JAB5_9TREM|nr:unnamed protein product [Schistosoma mattheei]
MGESSESDVRDTAPLTSTSSFSGRLCTVNSLGYTLPLPIGIKLLGISNLRDIFMSIGCDELIETGFNSSVEDCFTSDNT